MIGVLRILKFRKMTNFTVRPNISLIDRNHHARSINGTILFPKYSFKLLKVLLNGFLTI